MQNDVNHMDDNNNNNNNNNQVQDSFSAMFCNNALTVIL